MTDVETNIETLTKLQAVGVYISIDDSGTAYSSLNYLKHLPVNSLKIDKSFGQDIGANAADAAIVRAVAALGKSMNFTLIAEGVETEARLAFLRGLYQSDLLMYSASTHLRGVHYLGQIQTVT